MNWQNQYSENGYTTKNNLCVQCNPHQISNNVLHRDRKVNPSQVLVTHAYYPSYSGGRDQEDCSSKPAQANSSTRPYLEKTHHKKGLVEWLKV
jgi:hypothetical protein